MDVWLSVSSEEAFNGCRGGVSSFRSVVQLSKRRYRSRVKSHPAVSVIVHVARLAASCHGWNRTQHFLNYPVEVGQIPEVEKGEVLVDSRGHGSLFLLAA